MLSITGTPKRNPFLTDALPIKVGLATIYSNYTPKLADVHPSTQNYPLKRWKESKWVQTQHLESVPKLDRNDLRIKRLIELKINLTKEQLSDLLSAVNQLKEKVKNLAFPRPCQSFRGILKVPKDQKGLLFDVNVYSLENTTKKDIVVAFDNHRISQGNYKTVYHGFTATGAPKHLAFCITNLANPKIADITDAEIRLLTEFRDSKKTVKIFKSVFFTEIQKQHQHQIKKTHNVMILNYCPNELLGLITEILRKRINQSYAEKLALAIDLADALKYLKDQEIIYSDVKPDNILLNGKGNIRLCDFGLSFRFLKEKELRTLAGTLFYMPYEILIESEDYHRKMELYASGEINQRPEPPELNQSFYNKMDEWGLGCILWLIFKATVPPWISIMQKVQPCEILNGIGTGLEAIQKFNDKFPVREEANIDNLIRRILDMDPNNRPSMTEIYNELLKLEKQNRLSK